MKRIKLATKYIYFRRKFTNEKETTIRDGFVWIVDTPAWMETIEHPEVGHWEPIPEKQQF